MKSLLTQLIYGQDSKLSGLIALVIVAAVALGCTCGKNFDLGNSGSNSNSGNSSENVFGGDTEDVDEAQIKATVKSTTAAFANAVSTGDFSRLYADTAQEFKEKYTEEQFKGAFNDFTRQKRQLLPIVAKTVSMDPEYDTQPSTRTESSNTILTASGKYSTKPLPVTFKYEYVKRDGSWKLLKIEINVK